MAGEIVVAGPGSISRADWLTILRRNEELEALVAWYKDELGLIQKVEDEDHLEAHYGLTQSEAMLVLRLYRARKHVLTRIQLEDGYECQIQRRTRSINLMDIHVSRIRKKMGAGVVETIWGRGFRLTALGVTSVEAVLRRREALEAA